MANQHFFLITVALLGGAVLLTTACGSSNSNPAPGSSTGGTGAAAGSSTGGTAGGSTGGTGGGTGGTGGTSTGGTGGAGCTGSDFPSCYSCAPKTNGQYLNACKGGCQPFDNSTLSRLKSGHLPPLP